MSDLKAELRRLPTTIAAGVAREGAPAITGLAAGAYDTGRTAYDDPRPLGVDGQALSLQRTGLTRGTMRFVSVGTILRCVLGPKYARYLIGKYGILPGGKSSIPVRWRRSLDEILQRVGAGAVAGGR